MNKKLYDAMRAAQVLIPAFVGFFGVLDSVFGWGLIGKAEALRDGLVALIGAIVSYASTEYFKDKEIVPKEREE